MVEDRRLNRRDFMGGIAAGFLTHRMQGAAADIPATLTGDHFDLVVDWQTVNITGRRVRATVVNGSLPRAEKLSAVLSRPDVFVAAMPATGGFDLLTIEKTEPLRLSIRGARGKMS